MTGEQDNRRSGVEVAQRTCQVCEQEPAKWHIVTLISGGRIEGDMCAECGGDVIEAELYDWADEL